VTFDDNEGADAMSINTCGRKLILSTRIVEEDVHYCCKSFNNGTNLHHTITSY